MTRDGIVGQGADEDGQLLDIGAPEVAEVHVTDMRRHELAEHKATLRFRQKVHAASLTASTRMALRHSYQPQNALKKKNT